MPRSTLGLYGPTGVTMEAAGGEVGLSAYRDVKIGTKEGKVKKQQLGKNHELTQNIFRSS